MSVVKISMRDKLASGVNTLRTKLSQKRFLALLGIVVGVAVGVAAALLKDLITEVARLIKGIIPIDEMNIFLLIVPLLGILLCGIYCRYVVRDNLEFGTQKILKALNTNQFRLKRHIAFAPAIACALTIGFGGSAGSEGPIAYTGAGIGSNIGKYFRLPDETLRTLIIIGAGAGIAGIFKAPIGGALFALEVLGMEMTTVTIIALVFACLAASFVAYALSGFTIDIPYMPKDFFITGETWAVILLGVFCAVYSIYYNKVADQTERQIMRIKNPWIQNLISGSLIGVLIFLFPVLYGEGYNLLTDIINGNDPHLLLNGSVFYHIDHKWIILAFLAGTILLKSIATSATNSGGGVGGDFAPTLFAGCMAGLFFATMLNTFCGTHLIEANFALFGMAAVMAGTIQAPLMAIFLTAEIVGDFAMFFPLTISALVTYAIVRLLKHLNFPNLHPSWSHHK